MHGPVRSLSPAELLEHAGFLRGLARELAGAERAEDVVQDAWVAALERPPRARSSLRGWLAIVTANLARNARRREARRTERERRSARPERIEPGALALETLEIQRALIDLVVALPEEQRTVLVLRYYEDMTPTEIAARLGAPVKTVKTRHTRALAELRERLDERSGGDRSRWVSALLPLARKSTSLPESGSTAIHVMTSRRLWVGVSVVLVALIAWRATCELGVEMRQVAALPPENEPELRSVAELDQVAAPATVLRLREPGNEALQATGALMARFSWSDGTPAAGVWVFVRCENDPAPREERFVEQTDEAGVSRFAELFAGPVELETDRGGGRTTDPDHPGETFEAPYQADVAAGQTSSIECTIPDGFEVEGEVVDAEGRPVGHAEIWAEIRGYSDFASWPMHRPIARTGAGGSFLLRDLGENSRFRAQAPGHRASSPVSLDRLLVGPRGVRTATLELGSPGGRVEGRVLDPDGRPVSGAVVLCGEDEGWGPTPTTTEENGSFAIPVDLEPGSRPLYAGARGHPYRQIDVEIEEGRTTFVEVHLERSAAIEGRVLTTDDEPAAGMFVRLDAEHAGSGLWGDMFPPARATTDEEGRFRLEWVAPGVRAVEAMNPWDEDTRRGQAVENVICSAGETSVCELVLELGSIISGRVVDGSGRPLAAWRVMDCWLGDGFFFPETVCTDEEGRFLLTNVRNCAHTLRVSAPDDMDMFPGRSMLAGVRPGATDLVLVADPLLPRGIVRGVFVGPDGAVPQDGHLSISAVGSNMGFSVDFDPATGVFLRETLPGRYTLSCMRGELRHRVSFDIGPGEVVDLGTFTYAARGLVEIMLHGAKPEDLEDSPFFLHSKTSTGEIGDLEYTDGILRSEELVPGTYVLGILEREDIYLRPIDIVVKPGETIRVERTVEQGFTVRLAIENPNEDELDYEARATDGSLLVEFHGIGPDYRDGRTTLPVTLPAGLAIIQVRSASGLACETTVDAGPALTDAPPIEFGLR